MGGERDGSGIVASRVFSIAAALHYPSIAILKSCKLWQPFVTLRTYLPKAKGYFVCVCSTQAFLCTAFYFCWDFLANYT